MIAVTANKPYNFRIPIDEYSQTLSNPTTIEKPSAPKLKPRAEPSTPTISTSYSLEFISAVGTSTGQVIYHMPYTRSPMNPSLTLFEKFLAVLALLSLIAMIIGFVLGGLYPGKGTGIILPLGVWVFFFVGLIARRVQHRTK